MQANKLVVVPPPCCCGGGVGGCASCAAGSGPMSGVRGQSLGGATTTSGGLGASGGGDNGRPPHSTGAGAKPGAGRIEKRGSRAAASEGASSSLSLKTAEPSAVALLPSYIGGGRSNTGEHAPLLTGGGDSGTGGRGGPSAGARRADAAISSMAAALEHVCKEGGTSGANQGCETAAQRTPRGAVYCIGAVIVDDDDDVADEAD